MPHLRFTRDRRGYEHTFIVDRDRSRPGDRSVVLYWFRTPPDIRVGRGALDEEARRGMEAEHPGIRFDWRRILEDAAPEGGPNRGGREAAPGAVDPLHGRRARRNRHRPPAGGEHRTPETPATGGTAEASGPAPHAED